LCNRFKNKLIMERDEFEKLTEQAVLELPIHIREKMNNVEILVEDEPSQEQLRKSKISSRHLLLGLYEGVPQNVWGRGFGNMLPDKITIFQKAIESCTNSKEELVRLIKDTVWHEIGHHFGFNEREIRLLEKKRNDRFIKVKAYPSAGKNEIIKKSENNFEVWIKAKPIQGQANRAIISILSDYFNVPIENIKLINGFKQRNKVFEIKK